MGGKLVQEIVAFLSAGTPFAIESFVGLLAAPVIALLVCAIFIVTIGYCFKSLEKNPVIYTGGLLFSLGAGWLVVYEFCHCVPHPRDVYLDIVKSAPSCGTGLHYDATTKQCVSSLSPPPNSDRGATTLGLSPTPGCPAGAHYDFIARRCLSYAPSKIADYLKTGSPNNCLQSAQCLLNVGNGSVSSAWLQTRPNCEPGKHYTLQDHRCVADEPPSPSTDIVPQPFGSANKSMETLGERFLRNITTRDLSNATCGPNQHLDLKTFLCSDNAAPAPPSPAASGRAPPAHAP